MKKLIILIIVNIFLVGCGVKNKIISLEKDKIKNSSTEKKESSESLNIKHETIDLTKNINGNISLKIIPSEKNLNLKADSIKINEKPRKIKVKDHFGAEIEYELGGNETLIFESQNSENESLKNLNESQNIVDNLKTDISQESDNYKEIKIKDIRTANKSIFYILFYLLGLFSPKLWAFLIKKTPNI